MKKLSTGVALALMVTFLILPTATFAQYGGGGIGGGIGGGWGAGVGGGKGHKIDLPPKEEKDKKNVNDKEYLAANTLIKKEQEKVSTKKHWYEMVNPFSWFK